MASFDEHLAQANKNIDFLNKIDSISNSWEWKVTVSFYSAVHVINAHLAQFNLHYRNHNGTEEALNPFNQTSVAKIDEEEYAAYRSLNNLSRRARYLCSDKSSNKSTVEHLTHDKHYAKAVKKLDLLLTYFAKKYKISFSKTEITCVELKDSDTLKYFVLSKVKV